MVANHLVSDFLQAAVFCSCCFLCALFLQGRKKHDVISLEKPKGVDICLADRRPQDGENENQEFDIIPQNATSWRQSPRNPRANTCTFSGNRSTCVPSKAISLADFTTTVAENETFVLPSSPSDCEYAKSATQEGSALHAWHRIMFGNSETRIFWKKRKKRERHNVCLWPMQTPAKATNAESGKRHNAS